MEPAAPPLRCPLGGVVFLVQNVDCRNVPPAYRRIPSSDRPSPFPFGLARWSDSGSALVPHGVGLFSRRGSDFNVRIGIDYS